MTNQNNYGKNTALLNKFLSQSSSRYAVWDADNTIWKGDLEEYLMPYLESKGVLSLESLPVELKIIPFAENESMYAYYIRLESIDVELSYAWIAQVFAGFQLKTLKIYVDEIFETELILNVQYEDNGQIKDKKLYPPRIYQKQKVLINDMKQHGMEVYIVTACLEELARMVLSDEKYGLNIKPENVIGVSLLLKDQKSGDVTTARMQVSKDNFFNQEYSYETHMDMVTTTTLCTPNSWYQGKSAAIKKYISDIEPPIFVAGDAPTDHSMFLLADVKNGGLRMWVARSEKYTELTKTKLASWKVQEQETGHNLNTGDGWVFVTPEELQ